MMMECGRPHLSKTTLSSFEQSMGRLSTFTHLLPNTAPESLIYQHLMPAMDRHNSMTAGHMRRVGELSFQLALDFSHLFPGHALSERELLHIYYGGVLHDIGKLETPNSILNGITKLTPEEMKIVEFHPYFSYVILSNIPSLKHLAPFVLSHHERWNGDGYPHRIKKEQIPLEAQIIAMADVYDAFRQSRPYFPPVPTDIVYSHMGKNAGTHFSPHLMNVFERGFRFSENVKEIQ